MSSADRSGPAERVLLAAGTASYDCPDFPALDKVPDALRTVVAALKDLGFTTVARSPGYRLDPAQQPARSDAEGRSGARWLSCITPVMALTWNAAPTTW